MILSKRVDENGRHIYLLHSPIIQSTIRAPKSLCKPVSRNHAGMPNNWKSRMEKAETYNDGVVRQFAVMTVVWGIVGMLVGIIVAAQLIWPQLNFDLPFLTYSRLRPLHTNAVIFAFGGSALFATSYYVVQRTCHVRLAFDKLAAFTFWGWQLVILLAAISLPLGITQGKEYAELEWPIDLLIAVVWVAYAIVFFATVGQRRVIAVGAAIIRDAGGCGAAKLSSN